MPGLLAGEMRQLQLPCPVSDERRMALWDASWARQLTKDELLDLIAYEEWWLAEKGWPCYAKNLWSARRKLEKLETPPLL